MYHAIVRRKILASFSALNRGDIEVPLAAMAPSFEHIFAGAHPLGGTRHTGPVKRRWFERLYRLVPSLHFTIKHIAVSGWPWDTTVVVEWRDGATLADGSACVNDGARVIGLRWGKVIRLHAYLDTAVFADACKCMATAGIAEAAAEPIVD